ncbi:MAG TPA: endopeptidase La [Thermoanaerobaculia bacterium]|nr:endopeptidase La [Thermoanaerobaculia bacterium]HQP86371.1 endopeptidase La [Thermoanaerobaculia bacterium]
MAEETASVETIQIPDLLPVLPLKDVVLFPYVIVPLSVSRDRSIAAVDAALSEQRILLLLAQKDPSVEEPTPADLYETGTAAAVMRMLKLPDGRIRLLVQGLSRVKVDGFVQESPSLRAKAVRITEPEPPKPASEEAEALLRAVKEGLEKAVSLGKAISPEVMLVAAGLDDPARLADLAASNLDLKLDEAQKILETLPGLERLKAVLEILRREIRVLTVQQEISGMARGEIDKNQREYFLRQQLKAIQQELGVTDDVSEEVEQYRKKLEGKNLPPEATEEVEKQLKRLERGNPDSAETATIRTFLDWITGLPWSVTSADNLDLPRARAILDEDHYGLEKPKERILEFLAVRKLAPESKGPILCLVGPPGVGKTSLGRSIARALDRKFVQMSLGGVRDEAEIRGHRRTYVGALPGRVIQGINQAATSNPVFILDEVDKIGADFRGDPSSALLEVLDPEQNRAFRDHYLGVPYDLSKVLFITTANVLDTIQPAFLDRMEVIRLSGYTLEEKLAIARRHLVPKQRKENGLSEKGISFPDDALKAIIEEYTREAGLRNLEREIGSCCRKVAVRIASGKTKPVKMTPALVRELLGVPKFRSDEALARDEVGAATGLAWTAVGGDVLIVEARALKGKGRLQLTGQLGDVMKESAQAALTLLRSRADELRLPASFFESHDVHVHVPEGAIPKDGPSAGVTMLTAMVSAFTGTPVRRDVAMTGEITLRGEVLPIGGVKEKTLAARRAGIRTILLPAQNERDLAEIPEDLRRDLTFRFVDRAEQVLENALVRPAARRPVARKAARRKTTRRRT